MWNAGIQKCCSAITSAQESNMRALKFFLVAVANMRALQFCLVALALSAIAIYAQLAWSAPIHAWPAIRAGTLIDAQWIQTRFPFHLISPHWIRASGLKNY